MAATSPAAPRKRQTSSPRSDTFTGFRPLTFRASIAGYQYSRRPSVGISGRMSPVSLGMAPGPGRPPAGATLRRGAGRAVSFATAISSARSGPGLGPEYREALVGVEAPRLDEVALVGLPAELLHGAGEGV